MAAQENTTTTFAGGSSAALYDRFVIDEAYILSPRWSRSTHWQIHLDYSAKLLSRSAYLPGIKLHRRSRALTRVERPARALYRFTFITSNIDHVQRARFIYATRRIVARPVTEIVSRFDQRVAFTSDFVAAFSRRASRSLDPPPPSPPPPGPSCFIWLTALPRISIPTFRLFPSFSRQSA